MPLHTGHGTPRDLADVAVDAVLSMDGQPTVLQQSAVLAGIASVRQVYDQQVCNGYCNICKSSCNQDHMMWIDSTALSSVKANLFEV